MIFVNMRNNKRIDAADARFLQIIGRPYAGGKTFKFGFEGAAAVYKHNGIIPFQKQRISVADIYASHFHNLLSFL